MSHFSRIQTKMSEKKYTLQAIKDLGYAYEESEDGDLEVTGFGRQKAKVHIKIKLPFSYDIGLRWNGKSYEVVADWFGIRKQLNEKTFTDQLMQRYSYNAARDKLTQQGFNMVEEKVEETGQIRIVLRRMA